MWLDSNSAKLPTPLIERFKQESKILSVVVPWEIRIKASLGKLDLRADLDKIVEEQVRRNRFGVLEVSLEHVYELDELPQHHRDPFDRLLIAQARVEGYTLVTNDTKIQAYDVPTVWDEPT